MNVRRAHRPFRLTIFVLLVTLFAFASPCALALTEPDSFVLKLGSEPYESGPQMYQQQTGPALSSSMPGEVGYVEVPLDYDHPARKTAIFYRIAPKFDQTKPTVLYFNGGPGENSQGTFYEDHIDGFNIIYFDQRGIGFSRMPEFADLQNPNYFSSEFVALDAKLIIEKLGLKKVSIYGQSYGTVPATIFAHRFPESTIALVLEGTIFNGTSDLWINRDALKSLQNFFDALPPGLRHSILQLSHESSVLPKSWFSQIAFKAMYESHFKKALRTQLDHLFTNRSKSDTESELLKELTVSEIKRDWAYFSSFSNAQFICQEFGAVNVVYVFGANDQLEPKTHDVTSSCLQLPGIQQRLGRTYFARRYPVYRPTTYFQGREDGSTGVSNAIDHYHYVSRGHANLVLIEASGHYPMMACLTMPIKLTPYDPNCAKAVGPQSRIFQKALLGESLTSDEVRALGDDWSLAEHK